jgi:hypothetical protein
MPQTVGERNVSADLINAASALSGEELRARMTEALRVKTAAEGAFAVYLAESKRREMFREDGATSLESWSAECFGLSAATARSYAQVGDKARELPHLVGTLCAGDLSFDKIRAVVDVATRQTDQELCKVAREHSVRELVDVARAAADRARSASSSLSRSEHDSRYLRLNDQHRTISMQLPAESYAQTKACVDTWAQTIPAEGEVPLDQRRADGFMGIVALATSGSSGPAEDSRQPDPFFVVAHVPLDDLVDESGDPSELAGELEHHGLIDVETVQRIACDATVVVAVEDAKGHTMYEGRARRFPSGAQRREVIRRDRQCRFPGCSNGLFTAVHHIVPWKPGGGTDLDNLVLLCRHHHRVVHRNGWSMTGNPNEELTATSPNGRIMMSRPSPLWTRVSAARRRAHGSG